MAALQKVRLCRAGLYDPTLSEENGLMYPTLAGVKALIRSATLEAGRGVVIARLDKRAASFMAYNSLKHNNQTNEDLRRYKSLGGWSWYFHDDLINASGNVVSINDDLMDALSMQPVGVDYLKVLDPSGEDVKQVYNNQVLIGAGSEDDSPTGSIDLSELLLFVQANPIFQFIPNLKLTIYWENRTSVLFQDPLGTSAPALLQVKKPYLACEMLTNIPAPSPTANMLIPYQDVETEIFTLSSTGSLTTDVFRMRGMIGRHIDSLIFWVRPINDHEWLKRDERCVVLPDQAISLRIDNFVYLPDEGISHAGLASYYHLVSQGPLNVPYQGYLPTMVAQTDPSGMIIDPSGRAICSNLGPTAIKLGFRVKSDLTINFTHSSSGSHELVVFALVDKIYQQLGTQEVRVDYA
jgi:hypothetical protein